MTQNADYVRYVSDEDVCPECGGRWAYEVDGKRYSHVIALYSWGQDRTVAWRCPHCDHEWDRNAVVHIDGYGAAPVPTTPEP